MRYIKGKNKDYDISSIGKEYKTRPISGNNMPVNTAMWQLSAEEQLYEQMGQQIKVLDYWANNAYGMDTHYMAYQIETNEGVFVLFYGENAVKYIERKVSKTERNNLKGGLSHTRKIKDKPIEICDPIIFNSVEPFQREDKPGKHFYNVYYSLNMFNNQLNENRVTEQTEINSLSFCLSFKGGIVRNGQKKLCSEFFRSELYRLSKNSVEIMIPSYSGWYMDDVYGMVFLNRQMYPDLKDSEIPEGMNRRIIGKTERSVNEVYSDIKLMIEADWQSILLFALRAVSPLLVMLVKFGIIPQQIITVLVSTQVQNKIATAILKTNDFMSLDVTSINSKVEDVAKEIAGARDGVAVISGPQTVSESKMNGRKTLAIRDAAIGANGTSIRTRCIIALVGHLVPEAISNEYVLPIDCTDLHIDADVNTLRGDILEFDAAFIEYIENNFSKVDGIVHETVEKYKVACEADILSERRNVYIMLLVIQDVLRECFRIELFNEEVFSYIKALFTEDAEVFTSPGDSVKEEFIDVVSDMIAGGEITVMDKLTANKRYVKRSGILIFDKNKGLLSFEMCLMDKIAEQMNLVKSGAELTAALKRYGVLYCTDNGGRQITIPGINGGKARPEFYSVYLSEFGDDILDIIYYLDKEEFFFAPDEVPENFVPIIWHNGRCAGIKLDAPGLTNMHYFITGNSGIGKNLGGFRIAEQLQKNGYKVIFIDVKGSCREDQLREKKCDLSKYRHFDLKRKGIPFRLIDMSEFKDMNSKISYIVNVIFAGVPSFTAIQLDELTRLITEIVRNPIAFFELKDQLAKRQDQFGKKLKLFLQTIFNYMPTNGDYVYKSCREFLNDTNTISVLSMIQDSKTSVKAVIYCLLQMIYEYQVIDSSTPVMIIADEMQRYELDSPFKQLVSEGRQFNIGVTGITQEYKGKGDAVGKFMSNAGSQFIYAPTIDSLRRVYEGLNKKFSIEELESMEIGDMIYSGFLWSKIELRHKNAIVSGRNDDPNFSVI